jgi:hypothetical protein
VASRTLFLIGKGVNNPLLGGNSDLGLRGGRVRFSGGNVRHWLRIVDDGIGKFDIRIENWQLPSETLGEGSDTADRQTVVALHSILRLTSGGSAPWHGCMPMRPV